jgi:exopolyphosphatase/guanosine-5'-triphosphate,3'-diphosphate pyrophosphatase
MQKYAIIDLGTNSVKFFLAEIKEGKINTIIDTNEISRLGEGLQKAGIISPEAFTRNIEVLKKFKQIALKHQVDKIHAVGTMCLRTAKNAADFIKAAESQTGIDIKVLNGEQEARLSYLAVVGDFLDGEENIAVFDTGGGSTEFIFGKGEKLKDRLSLDIGAVRLTEEYLKSDPVSHAELKNMLGYIIDFFKRYDLNRKVERLVGIGGTLTSMGAVKHKMKDYDPQVIQGSELTLAQIDQMIAQFAEKTVNARKEIVGLQPKRADVILAGAAIVRSVLSIFHLDRLTISDRGLRHGLLLDLIR